MPSAPDTLRPFQAYQLAMAERIRNPRATPRPLKTNARRLRVYEQLVYHNLESFLLACFPVLRQVLGVRAWTRLVRRFLAEHRCRTPLFRDIPAEFVHYLNTQPPATASLPPWLTALAHYEWLELALSISAEEIDWSHINPLGDLINECPTFNPILQLCVYPYAVQRIGPRYKPTLAQQQETRLLVFRNLQDEIRFIELNPLSAALLQKLQQTRITSRDAVMQLAAALPQYQPDTLLEAARQLLHQLQAEQAILGTYRQTAD